MQMSTGWDLLISFLILRDLMTQRFGEKRKQINDHSKEAKVPVAFPSCHQNCSLVPWWLQPNKAGCSHDIRELLCTHWWSVHWWSVHTVLHTCEAPRGEGLFWRLSQMFLLPSLHTLWPASHYSVRQRLCLTWHTSSWAGVNSTPLLTSLRVLLLLVINAYFLIYIPHEVCACSEEGPSLLCTLLCP